MERSRHKITKRIGDKMTMKKDVVLCKDCVYYKHKIIKSLHDETKTEFDGYVCGYFNHVISANHYCSIGKEKIKKGDKVIIKGSAEEEIYKGYVFEVLNDPYTRCGGEVVQMKCCETGKYFSGGYATEFLEKVVEKGEYYEKVNNQAFK